MLAWTQRTQHLQLQLHWQLWQWVDYGEHLRAAAKNEAVLDGTG